MKFTIEASIFAAALSRAASIVSRGSLPILESVRVTAEGKSVRIASTGYGRRFTETVPAEVSSPGEICVAADRISMLIGNCAPGSIVDVATESRGTGGVAMLIKSGRMKARLDTLLAEGFPLISPPASGAFPVDAAALRRALVRAGGCMAIETERAYLCGIHVHKMGDGLAWVGTDSRKLARAVTDGAGPVPDNVVIPADAAKAIQGMIKGVDGVVHLAFPAGHIEVAAGTRHLGSALLVAEYPNYHRIIPSSEPSGRLNVDGDALRRAVTRVQPFGAAVSTKGGARVVSMSVEGDSLKIESSGDTIDHAEDIIECRAEGIVDVGVSGRQIADILSSLDGETIELRVHGTTETGGFVLLRSVTDHADEIALTGMVRK